MTNEQQRHLKEKLISELLEEVESIKTSFKNMGSDQLRLQCV